MDSLNKDELQIFFRILRIKKISYFENDPKELALTEDGLKNVKIELTVNISQDAIEGFFIIKFKTVYKAKENIDIFGLESESTFVIKDHDKTLEKDECGNMHLPVSTLNKFVAIAVGATRGMLVVMNTNPLYQQFVLPPIDVEKMLTKKDEPNIE